MIAEAPFVVSIYRIYSAF